LNQTPSPRKQEEVGFRQAPEEAETVVLVKHGQELEMSYYYMNEEGDGTQEEMTVVGVVEDLDG